MRDLFFYQREVKVPIETGEVDEKGNPVKATEIQIVWDFFNLNCLIRGHWTSKDIFTVMLNDGHEQADDVQKPIFKNGKVTGVETKRERAWFMSQIELNKEDAERLRSVTETLGSAIAATQISQNY
jgi:hypothetical protein